MVLLVVLGKDVRELISEFFLGNLPALRDGNVVVEGFKGIVEYLRGRKAEWDLDGSLMEMQKADGTA